MAFKASVANFNVNSAAAPLDTQDVTIPGFGTAVAALMLEARTVAADRGGASLSVRYAPANMGCLGGSRDSSNSTVHRSSLVWSEGDAYFTTGPVEQRSTAAMIADGLQLTFIDSPVLDWSNIAVMFGGAQVQAVNHNSNSLGADAVNCGFKPDLVIAVSVLSDAGTFDNFTYWSQGFACRTAVDGVKQASNNYYMTGNLSTADSYGFTSNTTIIDRVDTTAHLMAIAVTGWTATGFTFNRTQANTDDAFLKFLCIKFDDGALADLGITTSDAVSVTPDYGTASELVMFKAGLETTLGYSAGIKGNAMSLGIGAAAADLSQGAVANSTSGFSTAGITGISAKSTTSAILCYATNLLEFYRGTVTSLGPTITWTWDTAAASRDIIWISVQSVTTSQDINGDQSLPAFGQDATLDIHWTIDADQSLPAFTQAAELLEKSPGVNGQQSLPPFSQEASIGDTSATPTVSGNQDLPAFGQDAVLQLPDSELNADQDLPAFGQNGLIVDNVRSAAGTVQAWEYH